MSKTSPIESEFATTEDAEVHDAWVRAKVGVALSSAAGGVPHDQVMRDAAAVMQSKCNAADRLAR